VSSPSAHHLALDSRAQPVATYAAVDPTRAPIGHVPHHAALFSPLAGHWHSGGLAELEEEDMYWEEGGRDDI